MKKVMVSRRTLSLLIVYAVAAWMGPSAEAQDGERNQFFESKIRPLFSVQCNACHTSAASGGLRLDSREAILAGGNSGPAVVPGSPQDSLLIAVLAHRHERIKMPPGGKLADEQLAAVATWISDGAYWPEGGPAPAASAGYAITPEQRAFWSFQPISDPAPPAVAD